VLGEKICENGVERSEENGEKGSKRGIKRGKKEAGINFFRLIMREKKKK
jgi:hypothetical protein